MAKEVTTISPEGLEIANSYLQFGNIRGVVDYLNVPENKVVEVLNKREVKRYIDTVYLDMGYRNKNNIASVLDEMIASKLEEAQETGVYSSKDLADLLQMAHKMRMDEIKAQAELEKAQAGNIKSQTNVQINEGVPFGQGNYGSSWKNYLRPMDDKLRELETEFARHEVQCEERWKTTFNRLGDIDEKMEKAMSRQLSMGGGIILFLAGLVVTILTTMG